MSSFASMMPRFSAVALLMLGLSSCSSKDSDLFGGVQGAAASGGASATAGTSGGLNLAGSFGLIDGNGDGGTSAGGSGDGHDAGVPEPYVLPPNVMVSDAGVVLCGGAACVCNNGIDDDGDGKTDGFDEECTGALDDDEGSFATGISGDNSDAKWQDCFFDGNSGAGDDQCRYHADCLTGALPPTDPDCTVSQSCHDFCQVRVPNGCDCFGCCAVQLEDASTVNVFIGSGCDLENIDDAASCPPCTPSAACGNGCGECELCPGKGIEDLPESCTQTPSDGSGGSSGSEPPAYTCDAGQTVCGAGGECPAGEYCSLGCCLAFMIY